MGNGFCKNKQRLILIFLFYILFFSVTDVYASFSEFELFDKAYENYLSYRPEEAIKDFKAFLEEFPDSSAKDAANFWLAKSLIQMKSFEEAKEIFSDIKKQFPESPFLPFVDRELEDIKKLEAEACKKNCRK
jgi:TolA-binding protein